MRKILLTGVPGSGKSTLLQSLMESVGPKQGFLTKEVRENGVRTGFEVITAGSERLTFASVGSESPVRVAKYGVEVGPFEAMIPTLFNIQPDQTLYIDEIGEMQVHSKQFQQLVTEYLDSPNLFIGTITSVYVDDFIKRVKKRRGVARFIVEPFNRNEVRELVQFLITERRK
jgi:nucleoside-triphosphatase